MCYFGGFIWFDIVYIEQSLAVLFVDLKLKKVFISCFSYRLKVEMCRWGYWWWRKQKKLSRSKIN